MIKAECLLALFAEEMDVMVIVRAFSFAFAEFVRECAASVLKGMYNVMFME